MKLKLIFKIFIFIVITIPFVNVFGWDPYSNQVYTYEKDKNNPGRINQYETGGFLNQQKRKVGYCERDKYDPSKINYYEQNQYNPFSP